MRMPRLYQRLIRRASDLFDFNSQIQAYHNTMVNLPQAVRDKLRGHRKANQDRLISGLPSGVTANRSSFIKQGSYAMQTTIQEAGKAYDIDDGLVLRKEELKSITGMDPLPISVKEMVKDTLTDARFNEEPKILPNCVRVLYAEGYHVDIPVYRTYVEDDETIQEIASDSGWKPSDPQRITSWFLSLVVDLNAKKSGAGSQLRRLIKLLKRFAKSRGGDWDMPSGLKLTMLAAECHKHYDRDDEAFHCLMKSIHTRLEDNLAVCNLADTGDPKDELTRTAWDTNMVLLRAKLEEALQQLTVVDAAKCTATDAAAAWEWVFQSDGFLTAYDSSPAKTVEIFEKAALLKAGVGLTDGSMRIGQSGVPNKEHRFYGEG